MNCPKCRSLMEQLVYDSIEVDRCTNCHGLWFDMLEAEQLRSMEGAESIDIGDPKKGELYNRLARVKCPRCDTQMEITVDEDQSHIWYELCYVCHGMFFDAGEFRDYKERNVLNYFKALFSGSPG